MTFEMEMMNEENGRLRRHIKTLEAELRGASDAQGLTTVPAHTTRESSGHPTNEVDCGCIGPRDCTGECCEKAAVEPVNRPPNCGTGFCSCVECVMEP